jgi:hypothetical protein
MSPIDLPPPASLPPRSIAPGAIDPYMALLRDTRALKREHAHARDAWIARLAVEKREDVLFELEVLLKGLACFANPRNHPGPSRRAAVVAVDFRDCLALAREAMGRIVSLARALLHDRDKAFAFQRYLEMVVPDDLSRAALVRGPEAQETPEESLFALRATMSSLLEVTGGLARLPRVPFRLFYAMLGLAHREVARSAYFNPLAALEFRPEFDRITNTRVLELMRQVPGEDARRLVALTFLALFRMLRYLALLEHGVREGEGALRRTASGAYFVLAVLRSDARALTRHLRQRAGAQLAESYERELFKVPAWELAHRYDMLRAEGHRLLEIKATLGGIAANVRLEMRRAFAHDFPAPTSNPSFEQLRAAVGVVVSNLRPALQNAVLVLGKCLGARLDDHGVFDDGVARRALSERLRRDIWMFAQIIRAFGSKAQATTTGEERWAGVSSLQFVNEFLAYFRAMGYPLLRTADYPRFDPFLEALSALQEADLLDPVRLARAVDEAAHFYEFLTDLFERIGQREELRDIPFDRRAAASALRLYLGDM